MKLTNIALAFPEYSCWTPYITSKHSLGFLKHVSSIGNLQPKSWATVAFCISATVWIHSVTQNKNSWKPSSSKY